MKNEYVIEEIQNFINPIFEKLSDHTIKEFRIKDLDIKSGVMINDIPIEGKGLNTIFKNLRIKNNFIDFQNKMSDEDWDTVSEKLKGVKDFGDNVLYGKVIKEDDRYIITDVYNKNEKKKRDDSIKVKDYFDWIRESLEKSNEKYSLKEIKFDERKETFNLTLLNNDSEINMLNNLDPWKIGNEFKISGVAFNYAPFFERLVCSNGNIATQYGFGSNISQLKFNNEKIRSIISTIENPNNDVLFEKLETAIKHLKDNNVSLDEFYSYRNWFIGKGVEQYETIVNKYFSEKPFYQAYGDRVDLKSKKWKSTADSGINAYDFFNMLTNIATHSKNMHYEDKRELQILSSNLLFKNNLDLEDIAAPVKVIYPKLAEMN